MAPRASLASIRLKSSMHAMVLIVHPPSPVFNLAHTAETDILITLRSVHHQARGGTQIGRVAPRPGAALEDSAAPLSAARPFPHVAGHVHHAIGGCPRRPRTHWGRPRDRGRPTDDAGGIPFVPPRKHL